MTGTEAFVLSEPVEEDLIVIEQAWKSGSARYTTRTDDIWYRTLAAPTPEKAREYAATWYPSANAARFTPVNDGTTIVPAAYAASTRAVSLWEVILRSVRYEGIRRIPSAQVRSRFLVSVAYRQPLRLFDIRRPRDVYLVGSGKRPPPLTAVGPSAYGMTARWAQAIRTRVPEIDGLIYESHQIAGHCVVLFQRPGQVSPAFNVMAEPQSLLDAPARTLLLKEAQKANIAVEFGDEPNETHDLGFE
jgi:hypothetical protein